MRKRGDDPSYEAAQEVNYTHILQGCRTLLFVVYISHFTPEGNPYPLMLNFYSAKAPV